MESSVVGAILKYINKEIKCSAEKSSKKEKLEMAKNCLEEAYGIKYQEGNEFVDMEELFMELKIAENPRNPEAAEIEKTKGNELLTQEKYNEAIEAYTRAICLDNRNHIYYANRAAAYLKLNKYQDVIDDCTRSIEISDTYPKSYARLGSALMCLNRHRDAEFYLKKALTLEPTNEIYKNNLEMCTEKLNENPQPAADIPGFPANMDFNAILGNPEVMHKAMEMAQNPQVQEMMRNMFGNMGGAPGGFPPYNNGNQ